MNENSRADVVVRGAPAEVIGQRLDEPVIELYRQLSRFLLVYKFAVEELLTKLRILSEEFDFVHRHDPIEHVTSRVKRPEAITAKMRRKGFDVGGADVSLDTIAEHLDDIAGVRVICPFVSDVYRVAEMLSGQHDVELLLSKDYIAEPKANGYRSLHLIVRIPVFLSSKVEHVKVEVQLRTIAMDFWATLEHKLFYKYDDQVPADFADELASTARIAAQLDERMQALHHRLR
ncbi:GTP pyrophosphokinase [Amycolatopsis sp. CA-230715]|uniref:GTP pyrophosphokinase n=1 Tax=Amycolatopsis sp. CA-230715 TaxID=2745196 RepID=UPI001C01019A|nr:GTP pyrophosphokinase family protein [Amycolatopsis sp. CA-230715]QWF77700.1 GTP pyrophosphokinase YwaC [Amycolatopsis sp. CA-230715]